MTNKYEKFDLFRIRRFKDRQRYTEMYDKYALGIRKYLVVKLPTQADVDEMLNTVFERGWKYFTNNKVDYPNALLRTIAKSLIADYYQRRPDQVQMTEEVESQFGDEGKSVREMEVSSEMIFLKKAIKEMREDHQEIIQMRFMDELSISEIAKIIGKTDNNTRVIVHRATAALRKIFKEE